MTWLNAGESPARPGVSVNASGGQRLWATGGSRRPVRRAGPYEFMIGRLAVRGPF